MEVGGCKKEEDGGTGWKLLKATGRMMQVGGNWWKSTNKLHSHESGSKLPWKFPRKFAWK